jgi:F-actin capping protein alpha subunit
MIERKYQEDLNKAFGSLSEGAFKALRRQLPITRQKIEWEKISGYRVSITWSTSIVGDITKDVAVGTGHWWREVEIKKIGDTKSQYFACLEDLDSSVCFAWNTWCQGELQ